MRGRWSSGHIDHFKDHLSSCDASTDDSKIMIYEYIIREINIKK